MDAARALEQVLVIAGWWLALSVAAWVVFFPLLRSASRGDAALDREAAAAGVDPDAAEESIDRQPDEESIDRRPAEERPAGRLALRRPERRGGSPGRS